MFLPNIMPHLLKPIWIVNKSKTLIDNSLECNTASENAKCFQNLGWDFLNNLYEGIRF